MLRKKTTTTIPEQEVGVLFVAEAGEVSCPVCSKDFYTADGPAVVMVDGCKPICPRCVRRDFAYWADGGVILQRSWTAVKMGKAYVEAAARRSDERARIAREEAEAAKAEEERKREENCDCDRCRAAREAANAFEVTYAPRRINPLGMPY